MPTYEYACTQCEQHLEVVQSFTDASLTECPACSGRLRKVFSPVGVVFKGSGFYKTDSRQRSGSATKSDSASGESAKSGSGTAGSVKSESAASDSGTSGSAPASAGTATDSSAAPGTPAGSKASSGKSAAPTAG